MNNNKMQSDRTKNVTVGEKIGYALGDAGNACSWSFISSFLMLYYTDTVGISPTLVATLFLVTRIWDAVNDPLIGTLSDHTNSSRGRYRPWILFGAGPLVVITALTFYNPTTFSNTGKVIYAYATYSLVVLAYTAVNIPYTALSAAITQDSRERGSLAGWRLTFSIVGAMLVAQAGTYLVPWFDKNLIAGQGYFCVAVLLGVFGCICYFTAYAKTHERVEIKLEERKESFKNQLKAVLHNKPLILTTMVHFLVGMTVYGKMAVMAYYFKYNVGNYGLLAIFTIVMQLSMAVGSMLSPKLSDKLGSKGKALSLSFVGYGVFSLINAAFTPNNAPVLFWILVALGNLCHGSGYAISYAVIPDTVEYGALKSGIRSEGLISSFTSFFNKVGMAIGTSLTAYILGVLSYNPGGTQSAQTLMAINIIMFVVSGISAIVMGILFLMYKLDYKTFDGVLEKLKEKAGENSTKKYQRKEILK